ncbi:MAG: nucleotide exchange factor GrpE [Abditibacteriales bacterium]|nr:nucleotide exchange factor GrpE [Abditibacteriales bacterium]MDW8364282.1 nucleotide exchange factor GrpE [Abditibacteriales bacterium]
MSQENESIPEQASQHPPAEDAAEVEAHIADADNAIQVEPPLDLQQQLEELQRELNMLREQNQELNDQYLRALADMENARRRHLRELADRQQFANERLINDLLPVLDNLERALEAASHTQNNEGLKEGVELTARQFLAVLMSYGVSPIDAIGQPFNPALHEAVGQVETDEHPEGIIAAELQRGYVLHGRTLRPSRVMVAQRKVTSDQ